MREHEAGDVVACRGQRAGGTHGDQLVGLRIAGGEHVAFRHIARERLGQRLAEGGMIHVQRREDMAFDIFLERLARHALHDVARQRRAIVRIGRHFSRREHPLRHPAHQRLAQGHQVLGVGGEKILDRLLEARTMRHQIAHRDRLAVSGRNLEIEIGVDVGVEIDLVLLDKLHHRRPGKELGDGAGAEQCALRIDRRLRLHIGNAVTFFEQHRAVLHHHDFRARDVGARDRVRHEAIEPGAEIGCGQFMRRFGGHAGRGADNLGRERRCDPGAWRLRGGPCRFRLRIRSCSNAECKSGPHQNAHFHRQIPVDPKGK